MVDDGELAQAYYRTGSVWKAGKEVGLSGQTAHARLRRLGIVTPIRVFTDEERETLKLCYTDHADNGTLDLLAMQLGRTKQFICRQARDLGLTNQKRPAKKQGSWKYMEEAKARKLFERFRKCKRGSIAQWCKKQGFDDLGFSRTMQRFFPDEWEMVVELRYPKQGMYRYGRQFEYRVRDDLKKRGFFVMRSPQSKSPVDLVAIKRGLVLFVQCKRSGVFNNVKEWNIFYDLCLSVGAEPIAAGMPGVRGIVYDRLTGKKDGSKKKQPREPYTFEEGVDTSMRGS